MSKALSHTLSHLAFSFIFAAFFYKTCWEGFNSILITLSESILHGVASKRNQSKLNPHLGLADCFSIENMKWKNSFYLSHFARGSSLNQRENTWANSFIITHLFQLSKTVIIVIFFYQPHFLFKSGIKLFFAI